MSDMDIKRKANEISEKYIDAFSLFEKCHKIYDSNRLLSDEDIQQLGKYISYYNLHYYWLNRVCNQHIRTLLQSNFPDSYLHP